jgi:uncharacterized protein with PIN domain
MALNPEQVAQLLVMLRQTKDVELTCPECLEELDKYAQGVLDETPIEGVLQRVREHLEACPFCNEEFQLVLETLRAVDE